MNQSLSETDPAIIDGTADTVGATAETASGVAETTPDTRTSSDGVAATVARLREQIDGVDAELVSIVRRRVALSKQIQAVRMAHGGRRREHSRELKIVNAYVDQLGREGGRLALTLLELCRGRA